MPHTTPTDAQLKDAYACAQWEDEGISYDKAMQTPELRRALVRLWHNQQRIAKNAGIRGSRRIEHHLTEDDQ